MNTRHGHQNPSFFEEIRLANGANQERDFDLQLEKFKQCADLSSMIDELEKTLYPHRCAFVAH